MAALFALILLTAAAATFGASFQPGDWYEGLNKPDWTPPNWLFGPVWTVLYIMIAIAGWFVWRAQGVSGALTLWALQLLLNAAWSWAMFGQHQIGLALLIIVSLDVVMIAFAIAAWPVSRAATFLFLPYIGWVTYAASLNLSLWRLNS